jgi:hypothetical protein
MLARDCKGLVVTSRITIAFSNELLQRLASVTVVDSITLHVSTCRKNFVGRAIVHGTAVHGTVEPTAGRTSAQIDSSSSSSSSKRARVVAHSKPVLPMSMCGSCVWLHFRLLARLGKWLANLPLIAGTLRWRSPV